jgi:TonB family protein
MCRILTTILCLFFLVAIGRAQHPDFAKGIEAYESGKYSESVNILKKITKENSNSSDAWYYLGLAFLGNGKSKDAVKPLEKAVKLKPDNSAFQASLAYAYLAVWDRRAASIAKASLKGNDRSALANFVLSVLALRAKSYDEAIRYAKKGLDASPKFSGALLTRSKALVASFSSEPYPPVRSPEARLTLLDESISDLEKYLQLETSNETKTGLSDYLKSVRFFADHYRQPGNLNRPGQVNRSSDPSITPLRITRKSAPEYTPSAREAGVEGTLTLIVEFRADGTIGHVIVAIPLEDSLDNAAIEAARRIKFTPVKRNGVAESDVRRVEYSFGFR